jgi:hypothetical protein
MYRTGILIMSDKGAAGEREDRSGEQILQILGPDYSLEYYQIIPDEKHIIVEQMKYACDQLAFRVLKYYSNFLYHLLPAHLNRIFSIQKYPAQKLPVIKSGY